MKVKLDRLKKELQIVPTIGFFQIEQCTRIAVVAGAAFRFRFFNSTEFYIYVPVVAPFKFVIVIYRKPFLNL